MMRIPRLLLSHIDVLNDEYISGWAFNRARPGKPLRLAFRLDGTELGSAICALEREDVRRTGMHPTGRCGFEYRFPDRLDLSGKAALRVVTGLPGITVHRAPLCDIQAAAEPRRPIFFMHIPKTAGTSFNNHVHGWFGYGKWHSHIEVLSREAQVGLLTRPQYVAGHLPFYKLRELPLDIGQIEFHTILREPYQQVHSHLAWIRGVGLDPASPFFHAHPEVVRELAIKLNSTDLSAPDGVVRFVEGLEGFQCDFFDNIQVRYLLDSRPGRVSADDLRQALDHLPRFSTIGVTERYQEYVSRCAAFYGRRHIPQRTRHNPSRVAPLFDIRDEAIRSALYPLVRYDRELYRRVLKQCVDS